MWLKIECHPNHESPRITTNSNLGNGRRGDLATPKAFASRELFLTDRNDGKLIVRADVRHLGSRASSENVSALLLSRRRQEDPPDDVAGRRINDSRPADRHCGRASRSSAELTSQRPSPWTSRSSRSAP